MKLNTTDPVADHRKVDLSHLPALGVGLLPIIQSNQQRRSPSLNGLLMDTLRGCRSDVIPPGKMTRSVLVQQSSALVSSVL